ncbi:MAG TPA: endonuclease [Ignavibacteria bacterium]|nr:endonuclease [Ignavibacteria bacterium]HMR40564.1 endonuclease [Ignavibacteria bacterium]
MNFKTILLAALAAVFIIASGNINAQNVPGTITFDTTLTNVTGNAAVFIKNPTSQTITYSVRTLTGSFIISSDNITIDPLDSVLFTLNFRSNQNITFNDFLIFESPDLNYSIVYFLTATAKYPDVMYSFTQGLIDEPLKLALKNFCSTNTNNNYTTSRTAMFSTIDDYNMDDTIECVYTGRKVYTTGIPSVNPPQSMNTEHTFPQGFFSQNEPMRSDVHHLYPTDETSNNRRNNYDFGIVVSNITWEGGGSKLGNDAGGNIVFEPRDVHKGNVARSLFYFLIRYQNYGGFMDAVQENVLRQWNISDTVDARERFRENGIQNYQNNRSPFVDHPEFIDRIKSTFSVIPNISRPEISASPFNYSFDTLAVNDTSSLILTLFNYGTGDLNINSVNSSSPQFSVENFPSAIAQNELGYARIKFRPDQINQSFNSTLTILSNDTTIFVNLTGHSNNTVGVTTYSTGIPVTYSLQQNYPNPFNPSTHLGFGVPELGFVTLKIYDALGSEIATLVNENLSPGNYELNWNASDFPSGVYYYTLKTGNFSETKKMFLLK